MANFEELSMEDLNNFALEGNRLQHFFLRMAEELDRKFEGNVSLTIYSDDPWQTLEGFHYAGWKYVPAASAETYTKGHLVWSGVGSPNCMDLGDALHRHFRNSL